MALEVDVLITWWGDVDRGGPLTAVLRVGERELSLWHLGRLDRWEVWAREKYRPFRGPGLLRLLLTPFALPDYLLGRGDAAWVEGEPLPRLRIKPVLPTEVPVVEVCFRSGEDRDAVAGAVERLWVRPPARGGVASRFLRPIRHWWKAACLPVFLLTLCSMASDWWPWVLATWCLFVLAVMAWEVWEHRKDAPPPTAGGSGEPGPGR